MPASVIVTNQCQTIFTQPISIQQNQHTEDTDNV
jgi:hypothetical protein